MNEPQLRTPKTKNALVKSINEIHNAKNIPACVQTQTARTKVVTRLQMKKLSGAYPRSKRNLQIIEVLRPVISCQGTLLHYWTKAYSTISIDCQEVSWVGTHSTLSFFTFSRDASEFKYA